VVKFYTGKFYNGKKLVAGGPEVSFSACKARTAIDSNP